MRTRVLPRGSGRRTATGSRQADVGEISHPTAVSAPATFYSAKVAVITLITSPGALLVGRRHVDFARIASALCRG